MFECIRVGGMFINTADIHAIASYGDGQVSIWHGTGETKVSTEEGRQIVIWAESRNALALSAPKEVAAAKPPTKGDKK